MLRSFGGLIFLVSAACASYSQSASWTDPSPHRASFVTVDKDVRLEVLDWGGSGSAIVLLAGLGNTAHIFDNFALKLADHHHVYGITRRGFGASAYAGSDYGADRLGDDVIAVLDALKLDKPVLVGHSLGGEELSSVANRHPDRIAGAIYLDAGYWYAFDNGKVPAPSDYQVGTPPQPPQPTEADHASLEAYSKWFARINGFALPEGEVHQLVEFSPEGRVLKRRAPPPGVSSIAAGMKKYNAIPVRVLAIFANPHDLGAWIKAITDPAVQKTVDDMTKKQTLVTERQIKAFEEGVPTAKVVRLAGANHVLFLSNEEEVLREMRAFLSALPAR